MNYKDMETPTLSKRDLLADTHSSTFDELWKKSDTRCGAPHHEKPVGNDLNFGFFQDLKLEGFEQLANGKHEKTNWDSIKDIFSHEGNLNDQIQAKIIKDLDPKSRPAYDQEVKDLDNYKGAYKAWQISTVYPPDKPPVKPLTPMHTSVDLKAGEVRDQIVGSVRANMSTSDRARLAEQLNSYSNGDADAVEGCDPLGPMPLKPLPEPGNAVKDFWDKIRDRTDAFTKS